MNGNTSQYNIMHCISIQRIRNSVICFATPVNLEHMYLRSDKDGSSKSYLSNILSSAVRVIPVIFCLFDVTNVDELPQIALSRSVVCRLFKRSLPDWLMFMQHCERLWIIFQATFAPCNLKSTLS